MPNMPTNVSFCQTFTMPLNTTCCKTHRSPQHAAKHNIMLPNTTCYPACRPIHHHAVYHIAELNMLHSIPLNTTYRTTQHHAVQRDSYDTQHADKYIIMLWIIPLNSTYYPPTGHLTRNAARHSADHNILRNKLPNAAYCLSCASTRHVVQRTTQTNMLCNMLTDWPPNTTWKVTLTVASVFRACFFSSVFNNPWLSLVANIFPFASFCFKFAQYICDVRRVIGDVFQSSKGMLSMMLPNKPSNTIYCPAASCCTTCCPRHPVTHHAAQHITLLP